MPSSSPQSASARAWFASSARAVGSSLLRAALEDRVAVAAEFVPQGIGFLPGHQSNRPPHFLQALGALNGLARVGQLHQPPRALDQIAFRGDVAGVLGIESALQIAKHGTKALLQHGSHGIIDRRVFPPFASGLDDRLRGVPPVGAIALECRGVGQEPRDYRFAAFPVRLPDRGLPGEVCLARLVGTIRSVAKRRGLGGVLVSGAAVQRAPLILQSADVVCQFFGRDLRPDERLHAFHELCALRDDRKGLPILHLREPGVEQLQLAVEPGRQDCRLGELLPERDPETLRARRAAVVEGGLCLAQQ